MCFTHPSVRLTLLGFWEWQLTSTYQVDLGDSCLLGWQDPHPLLLTVLLSRKASADSCSIQGGQHTQSYGCPLYRRGKQGLKLG